MIRPNLDNILVKREDLEMRSESQLVALASDKNAPMFGRVLAVGPGIFTHNGARIAPRLEAGDIVIVAANANTTPLALHGRELCWLVREPEILAVVDESDVQKKRG